MSCKIDKFGCIGAPPHRTVAIEVGPDAYMVYSHHLDGMFQMVDSIEDGGFGRIFAQEAVVKSDMGNAPFLAKTLIWSSVRLRGTSHKARALLCEQTMG